MEQPMQADKALCPAGIPSCIQSLCIQKPAPEARMFAGAASLEIYWNAYSSSQIGFMHSQRAYSSTVSTGLSTISTAENGGISRFPPGLSTLSTGYPHPLSTVRTDVDIHVDSRFSASTAVYTCDKIAYICAFVHVRAEMIASSGRQRGRKSQSRNFRK